MFYTAQFVKDNVTELGLTRLYAFELNGGAKIHQCVGTTEQICDAVDFLVSNVSGGFRVEIGDKGDTVDKGGRPGANAKRKPFEYRMMGTAGIPDAPSQPTAVQQGAAKVPDGYVSKEHMAAMLANQELAMRLANIEASTKCVHGISWQLPCEQCEPDDEEEEEGEEAGTIGKAAELKEIVTMFRDLLRGGVPASRADAPITGRVASDQMTEEDRKTWDAIVQMRAQHPKEFKDYNEQLLSEYGKKPDADAKPE